MPSDNEEMAGFTRAYTDAAKKGTAIIEDAKAGVKTDHANKNHWKNDSSAPLRKRVATNLVRKLVLRNAAKSPPPSTPPKLRCLDIGCAIGNDLVLLKETLENTSNDDNVVLLEPIGLDLLGAQLEHARTSLPEGTFVKGNVTALPFDEDSMDSVQCSRLLIHVPDLAKAVDEMVRVLKPGGAGAVSEGNFYAYVVYTTDDRLKRVATALNQHNISQCAHPGAAMDAYKSLLAHGKVENLVIEPFPLLSSDPSYGLGMAYLKPALEAVVASGMIDQGDMDYYLETLPRAQAEGDYFWSSMMFEVTFDKTL